MPMVSPSWEEVEESVLEVLKKNPITGLRPEEIAKEIKTDVEVVRDVLNKLADEEKVKQRFHINI